ncbi:hypothetical protein TraAM80_05536 [Trypanosoma rangeli]|uniref:Transmembrane protein n=1 Tax=Trypanosoma rangeli TaxID=5698 RepID=A0A422NEB3_TRYRA|nr:uncharacterized protein TraAM80_05536 [Trypanosoma rangeli]RNF03840.1 hypothetical protein TraAM80_05536 [Trypanosoma rangeli]|eukprot:RNF03840.1 hypothetical protein TraAM80_05536 [Trypanosoma rangeli]
MPLPLGASISDPNFVFLQILHAMSLFFIILGVARVVLGILSLALIDSSAVSLPLFTSLGLCFHVPLRSLFVVKVEEVLDGSGMRFFIMHVLAALGLSGPLALTIQRRKYTLDFAFTLYVIYYVFSCVAAKRLTGGGFAWWLSVLAGFCVLYSVASFLCRRRELQDIFFPLPTSSSAAAAAAASSSGGSGGNTTTAGGGGGGGGGGDVMMTTLSIAMDTNGGDAEVSPFGGGGMSPRKAVEAVLMGPGSARKRRT